MISERGDAISEHGGLISEHGGVISDKVAWIRCTGEGVRIDRTSISDKVARIRSLVRLIRERCCHVKPRRANFPCTGVEKM